MGTMAALDEEELGPFDETFDPLRGMGNCARSLDICISRLMNATGVSSGAGCVTTAGVGSRDSTIIGP